MQCSIVFQRFFNDFSRFFSRFYSVKERTEQLCNSGVKLLRSDCRVVVVVVVIIVLSAAWTVASPQNDHDGRHISAQMLVTAVRMDLF